MKETVNVLCIQDLLIMIIFHPLQREDARCPEGVGAAAACGSQLACTADHC